jgi:hypothetical protein
MSVQLKSWTVDLLSITYHHMRLSVANQKPNILKFTLLRLYFNSWRGDGTEYYPLHSWNMIQGQVMYCPTKNTHWKPCLLKMVSNWKKCPKNVTLRLSFMIPLSSGEKCCAGNALLIQFSLWGRMTSRGIRLCHSNTLLCTEKPKQAIFVQNVPGIKMLPFAFCYAFNSKSVNRYRVDYLQSRK